MAKYSAYIVSEILQRLDVTAVTRIDQIEYAGAIWRLCRTVLSISREAIVHENSATVKRLPLSLIDTLRMPFATCQSTAFANASLAVSAVAVKRQSSAQPRTSNGMALPAMSILEGHARQNVAQPTALNAGTLTEYGERNLNPARPSPSREATE
jgi:hypothetical protein